MLHPNEYVELTEIPRVEVLGTQPSSAKKTALTKAGKRPRLYDNVSPWSFRY